MEEPDKVTLLDDFNDKIRDILDYVERLDYVKEHFPDQFTADFTAIRLAMRTNTTLVYNELGNRLHEKRKTIRECYNKESQSFSWDSLRELSISSSELGLNDNLESKVREIHGIIINLFDNIEEANRVELWGKLMGLLSSIKKCKQFY